jgi:hypothetical protein
MSHVKLRSASHQSLMITPPSPLPRGLPAAKLQSAPGNVPRPNRSYVLLRGAVEVRFLRTAVCSTFMRLRPLPCGLPRPCCKPKMHPGLTYSHHASLQTKAVAALQTQRHYTVYYSNRHSFCRTFAQPTGSPKDSPSPRTTVCDDTFEESGAVSALNSSSNHQWIWHLADTNFATTLSKVSSSVGYCFQTQQVAHQSPAGPSAVPRLVVLAAAALGPGPVEVLVRTRQPPGSSVLVVHFLRVATIYLSILCHQVSTGLSFPSTAQNSSLLYLTAPYTCNSVCIPCTSWKQ